jgi:hypothetical protein
VSLALIAAAETRTGARRRLRACILNYVIFKIEKMVIQKDGDTAVLISSAAGVSATLSRTCAMDGTVIDNIGCD